MSSVRDVCKKVLDGLDDDILEYVISMAEDDSADVSDLKESVSSFLMSVGFCSSETHALETCCNLFSQLQITKNSKEPEVVESTHVATQSIYLGDKELEMNTKQSIIKPKKQNKTENNKLMKKRKKRKNEKKNSKKPSSLDKMQSIANDMHNELETARLNAARSRSINGAFMGALEARSFTLPNPGGGIPLLENASCTFVRGRRYGLIGRNGKGKSTMLRALASRRVGEIPENVTVHYVSQHVQLNDITKAQTPVEIVVAADLERRVLLEECRDLEALSSDDKLTDEQTSRLVTVLEQLVNIDADSAETRAIDLLSNLGFTEELYTKPLQDLSGGWRVRTMLAAAIFARPDLLLLDEPTNHLSILAVMWLARELSTNEIWSDRIVVIVSHDRHFLDEVCSDVMHISGIARKLTQFHGNYSSWTEKRREQQFAYEKAESLRQREIGKLKDYAGHGFKYGGSSSQVNKMKMKEKQAAKIELESAAIAEELSALSEDIELSMNINAGGKMDGFLVQLKNISFGYSTSNDKDTIDTLFEGVECGITSDSRLVVLGENGKGKSTLVKLITGKLVPTKGDINSHANMRVAVVNQHHADQIDLSLTPLQYMLREFPGDGTNGHELAVRRHLASCGVTGNNPDLQNTISECLSGGQRSRVALAAVSFLKPHLLILDEPTNNLDLESVSSLIESLRTFHGAIIIVSHDQYFVNEVANECWVLENKKLNRVESFSSYRLKQMKLLKKIRL